MKKMYFAGHMEIDFDNLELSDLENDYRNCIVKNPRDILYSIEEPIRLNKKYAYAYPTFYYEDKEGKPSIESNLIVDTELRTLKEADILVAFLGEKVTAGTLGEIMYAASNNTTTHIYYVPTNTDSNVYATKQWYVILMAKKILGDKCIVIEVSGKNDLLDQINKNYGIEIYRRPNTIKK